MKVRSDEKDSGVMFYYFMFFAKLAEKKTKNSTQSNGFCRCSFVTVANAVLWFSLHSFSNPSAFLYVAFKKNKCRNMFFSLVKCGNVS